MTTAHRAFSLVELVIVMVILGIIAAIAVPRLGDAANRARTDQAAATVKSLQEALDRCLLLHDPLMNKGNVTVKEPILVGMLNKPPGTANLLLDATSFDGKDPGTIGPFLRNIAPNPLIGDNATTWVADNLGAPSFAGDGSEGWAVKIIKNLDGVVGYINATQDGVVYP